MKTGQNTQNRSEIGQKANIENKPIARLRDHVRTLSKTNVGYWKPRLRKRTWRHKGNVKELPDWHVKLSKDGKQRWVNLATPNAEAAAIKARNKWKKLQIEGWDALIADRRGRIDSPSIGTFLAEARTHGEISAEAFEIYANKLRRLVAGIFGIKGGTDRFNYSNGEHLKWRKRIHDVKLKRLTEPAIKRWQSRHLTLAKGNPIAIAKARVTQNSLLRAARALFSETKVVPHLKHLALPDPLPFSTVKLPRFKVEAYVSKVRPEILFQQAIRELENPTEEMLAKFRPGLTRERERVRRHRMFISFCLALFAGLRRGEIDSLTWKQVDFERQTIHLSTTEYGRVKTESSRRVVDIDGALTQLLREAFAKSKSPFVIAGTAKAKPGTTSYHHYRCNRLLDSLVRWLKAHDVEARNALHTMRKEYGSQINLEYGIFAASAALGHSSIHLTKSVYVSKKERTVFRMPTGPVINPAEVVV